MRVQPTSRPGLRLTAPLSPRAVSIRIKSVTNTAKITKSMKMVSAAKFKIAERELVPARVYGSGAQGNLSGWHG